VSRERRLGRGLEALLGRAGLDPTPATQGTSALAAQPARPTPPAGLGSGAARLILHAPEEVEQAAATLPTSDVAPAIIDPNPWQPRTVVDDADLAELANSLREHGLVQPIVVRARGDRYRRDLDALEKAASFKQYIATWNCTQDELAKRLSVDRSTVANLIRLLELPASVQQKLRSGTISMGHARALLPLGDEDEQVRLADRVAAEGLSVRAVEAEIQEIIRREEAGDTGGDDEAPIVEPGTAGVPAAPKRKPGRPATRRSSQVAAVESQLRQALGVKVVVHANGKGAGRIVIPFTDLDEFQRILDHICE